MTNTRLITLGLLAAASLFGCKEGNRVYIDCVDYDDNGNPRLCADANVSTPDATVDATVTTMDATAGDSTMVVSDASMDAFVLPTNACVADLPKTFTPADAGADAGMSSVLEAASNEALMNTGAALQCATMGFGGPFITCLAASINTAVPDLSAECSTCMAALVECIFDKCARTDADPCRAAADPNATAEQLAACNTCQCDNGCNTQFDTCAGFTGTAASRQDSACGAAI